MKNWLRAGAAFAAVLVMPAALASPAVQYDCVGKDLANKQGVAFSILFSDSGGAEDPGYFNQSLTFRSRGGVEEEKPLVFQMAGATEKNACQVNDQGETYLHQSINMEPAEGSDVADYQVSFDTGCAGDKALRVRAYCVFSY